MIRLTPRKHSDPDHVTDLPVDGVISTSAIPSCFTTNFSLFANFGVIVQNFHDEKMLFSSFEDRENKKYFKDEASYRTKTGTTCLLSKASSVA
jgi:hypothetical protein